MSSSKKEGSTSSSSATATTNAKDAANANSNSNNNGDAVPQWSAFYVEVERFLKTELGIEVDSAGRAAIEVNRFLMPALGRSLPATLDLAHDYVAYYRDATRSLYVDGHATGPVKPLLAYGPGRLTVEADPLGLCRDGLSFFRHTEAEGMDDDFTIGANAANELLSPLTRLLPHLVTSGVRLTSVRDDVPTAPPREEDRSTPVFLSTR